MVRRRQGFRVRDAYGGRDSEARQNGTSLLREDVKEARQKGAYIRFCETNPPFFDRIFDVTVDLHGCYVGMLWNISVGSFWKTNPKTGG